MIVAKTIKGKGVAAVENKEGWHGKALDDPEAAIEELGGIRNIIVDVAEAGIRGRAARVRDRPLELPTYELGEEVATRKAYGDALKALGDGRGDVVALDGEVSNSTFAEIFAKAHPDRYFEMFIAEQQLVAAAVGLQVRGWKPFASTFAAFFSRAYDFVRMAAISRAEDQALRLACGRLDRRGRPVADGARGSRGVPGRPRLDRPLPLGREPDGQARRGHGRPGRDLVHADDARRTRRSSTGRTRTSRSAGARSSAPRTTTR